MYCTYSCLQLKEAIVWTNNVSLGGGGGCLKEVSINNRKMLYKHFRQWNILFSNPSYHQQGE